MREQRRGRMPGRGDCLTDVGHSRRDSDFDTTVSLLCKLALEQLVEFGVEHSIGHELAALGDGALSGRHLGSGVFVEVEEKCVDLCCEAGAFG
jgi:hypothetical protein